MCLNPFLTASFTCQRLSRSGICWALHSAFMTWIIYTCDSPVLVTRNDFSRPASTWFLVQLPPPCMVWVPWVNSYHSLTTVAASPVNPVHVNVQMGSQMYMNLNATTRCGVKRNRSILKTQQLCPDHNEVKCKAFIFSKLGVDWRPKLQSLEPSFPVWCHTVNCQAQQEAAQLSDGCSVIIIG